MKNKKILIANRGEIAIRVARSARELGLIVIGLWTDNEPNASHLEYCHQWVRLEGSNNTDTFLNQDKLIALIKEHQVDAVHPGYGFLAENATFCKKITEMGVKWIGPNSKAIELMGDKAISKTIANEAGVPVVPGSTGEVPSVEEALKIAENIGYPVLLKAVAGGGGKGMRACFDADEVSKAFEAVKREAKSSFGNDGLLVEKFVVNPHHIEVQIIADKKGNIYHCFERECSVQRRHQKIIEEAPSPFIGTDEKLRANICETAVKLAQAVDYDSAGTVEFIMGADKSFYFLEMNTRIQVEHPITEEITGIDLVGNMIKAAFDEKLDFSSQDEIIHHGHSIECRICAEDPITMLPAPGKVEAVDTTFPQGVRFDHCLYDGYEITPDFDPMVGKLIVRGLNREACLRKMRTALDGLHIAGVKTNVFLHKVILQEEDFVKGLYDTNYIKDHELQDKVLEQVSINEMVSLLSVHEALRLEQKQ